VLQLILNLNLNLIFQTFVKKKASRQLNVLKRLGKYLNKLGKLTIYHSFILSNLNFCPLSWHFCSEANTNKIEKIRERALRFINSTYENLLIVSKLPTLGNDHLT
jgi:hypothetical protein